MATAFEIVMDSRRELVDKMLEMMKAGFVFTSPEWNSPALRPYNPVSVVTYKGGNRLRLMAAAVENGYKDPRWMTARQASLAGYKRSEGAQGILCEKWIFERKIRQLNPEGLEETVIERLEKPAVSFFVVYNAEQVPGFPKLTTSVAEDAEALRIADDFMSTSECPIIEAAQTDAYYSYRDDKIVLPPRTFFKDAVSFAKTGIHEMAHSTGHSTRLNRDMLHPFGSEPYAKEELRAEIAALFIEADIGIHLKGEHYQDHSNYLASWMDVLKNEPSELFRACSDAEKIDERLVKNYRARYPMPEIEKIPVREEKKISQKKMGRAL